MLSITIKIIILFILLISLYIISLKFNISSIQWYVNDDGDQCSTQCGDGILIRSVLCKDFEGNIVNDEECKEEKPSSSESCKLQDCGKWEYSEWTNCDQKCSSPTSLGKKTRTVECIGGTCLESSTGLTQRYCNTDYCVWEFGEWNAVNQDKESTIQLSPLYDGEKWLLEVDGNVTELTFDMNLLGSWGTQLISHQSVIDGNILKMNIGNGLYPSENIPPVEPNHVKITLWKNNTNFETLYVPGDGHMLQTNLIISFIVDELEYTLSRLEWNAYQQVKISSETQLLPFYEGEKWSIKFDENENTSELAFDISSSEWGTSLTSIQPIIDENVLHIDVGYDSTSVDTNNVRTILWVFDDISNKIILNQIFYVYGNARMLQPNISFTFMIGMGKYTITRLG